MDKANSNKRVCAFLIDYFTVNIIHALLYFIFQAKINSIFNLFAFLFLVFRDTINGQSPGKFLVGLKVINIEGENISFTASFKRNIILFWIYLILVFIPKSDLFPTSIQAILDNPYIIVPLAVVLVSIVITIIEYIYIAYRPEGRRIGDKFARTKVIELRPKQPGWIFFLIAIIVAYASSIIGNYIK